MYQDGTSHRVAALASSFETLGQASKSAHEFSFEVTIFVSVFATGAVMRTSPIRFNFK